ncbi:multicopper oxidase domain-containing protein [Microbulbifer epialgicus]|uniref:Multicopper oxidase domain-containing protein n=1 Tax=Microbulbifer epialgicus TaxID=393907 RepID=A0ABV4P0M2_9GAMM
MAGFNVPIDQDLRWRISEGSDLMLHSKHIHGCQFRLVKFIESSPSASMCGWKDTAPISNGGNVEIYVRSP